MQRNPENLKILLKEVDKMHENLDAPTKQRCVDLLKTLLYTREEIIEQVFWRIEKKYQARYMRLLTLIAKEAWLDSLADEKKRRFWGRGALHYQRLVQEHWEEYAKQWQLSNAYRWVEADWRVIYTEEEKTFIVEQKQILGDNSGVNKKIAELCNDRFHGWDKVRTSDWIGKQYYKRKKKGQE